MKPGAKGAERVSILFIAAGMSLLMSAAMLLFNVGVTSDFLWAWMKGWVVSTAIAYPAALLIVPVGRKITDRLTG
ncbi:MAG: DUF2798 domain-containing protein [Gammaproteobacteria bacterium]|nr:DUF2798 domain-containing protein [Gammaproteobacteria bacterium]